MRATSGRSGWRSAPVRTIALASAACALSASFAAGCSTDPRSTIGSGASITTPTLAPLPADETDDADGETADEPDRDPGGETDGDPGDGPDREPAHAVVDLSAPGTAIEPALVGTNIPAWLGPERLASDWFRSAIEDAGIDVMRMPGGSWSNGYGWSACELQLDEGCIWDEAARPADFADLLAATGASGLWTVSINETAESAGALVAYFNAELEDPTVIGVDRDGTDWGTAGDWAAVRAFNGRRDPVRIELWEIGNEVFAGSRASAGDDCAEFGWETVWTCDGTEYVEGDDDHDGFLAIRDAMLAVDPDISVGAVGVPDPAAWGDWGREVIDAAGGDLDFYSLHAYGFDGPPDLDAAGDRAVDLWPALVETARRSLPDGVPIAVTEYNLVAVESADEDQLMTRAVNALFVADTIGQLAAAEVAGAYHWNLANGTAASGTDYGLIDADTGERSPQFDGLAVWGRAGDRLLPLLGDPGDGVRIYPTRHDDGAITLVVVHAGGEDRSSTVEFDGVDDLGAATVTSWWAAQPDDTAFDTAGPTSVPASGGRLALSLPPWSITEVRIEGDDVR